MYSVRGILVPNTIVNMKFEFSWVLLQTEVKGTLIHLVKENSAQLCPAMWKAELVRDELEYLAVISKHKVLNV